MNGADTKEMRVSLLVTTASLDLLGLSKRLECAHSPGSHDKGAPRAAGRQPFDKTIWRVDSSAPSSAPLTKHCETISAKLSATELLQPGRLPQDAKIYLDIAVFFSEASCTINIPVECVDFAKSYNAEIEVSCYPSSQDE
jgi:hypothetical protein